MIVKTLDNICYISSKASDGAMVKPGEITEIHYNDNDEPCENGTVRYFATDGWVVRHLGRYTKAEIRKVAKKALNKDLEYAGELFGEWVRNNKR